MGVEIPELKTGWPCHVSGAFESTPTLRPVLHKERRLMDMRTCSRCRREKPLTSFSKTRARKSGYQYWCRVCSSEYYRANRERLYLVHKKHNMTPERKQLQKQYGRAVLATEGGRIAKNAAGYIRRALRAGKISKPETCSSCGDLPVHGKIVGHHPDYTKPLEVVWLCPRCHRKEHASDTITTAMRKVGT